MILLSSNTRLRRKRPKLQSTAKRIRIAAGAMALLACISMAPVPAYAFDASDCADYSTAISSGVGKFESGDKIRVLGKPDYTTTITEDGCNYFRVSSEFGDWYIATGKNTATAVKKSVSSGEAIYYGTYAGKLESQKAPILDIRGGAIMVDKKLYDVSNIFAAEDKAIKEKEEQEKKAKEKASDPDVYISSSGKKYHRSRSCSSMKAPKKVKKSYATEHGYTACQKCY